MRFFLFTYLILFGFVLHAQYKVPVAPNPTHFYDPTLRFYTGTTYSVDRDFKTSMTIVMKDGSEKQVRVQYDATDSVHVLKEITKKGNTPIIFTPSDTKRITRLYDGQLQIGIPADSCWLFKTITGRMNAYSYLPQDQLLTLGAIQSGERGPILPLTKENLHSLIPNASDRVKKMIDELNFLKAIEIYNRFDKGE